VSDQRLLGRGSVVFFVLMIGLVMVVVMGFFVLFDFRV